MNRASPILAIVLLLPALLVAAEVTFAPGNAPPPPIREFRGAWVATVANIDWPSKPGLSVDKQKAELVSLFDRAAQMHFNAIFFQVRPVADAIYASLLEPWSEYLTGTQGKMPQPYYDPLAFAIVEAHKRGLQLHAWFNPFRAGHPESKSPPALNHVTKTHPELVRRYGSQTWFDPGEPESRVRASNAVLDVVKRYDVDGVVFDDYFYPYPEKNRAKQELDFPDDASWKNYGLATGLARDDWRRGNINQFVQKVSQSIHAAKPWVQFGISPFGIWRPGVPAGIDAKALDAYGKLYADARLWLANGWVDYLAPQLYWPISQREHSFTALLEWWRQQNTKNRHVFAGLSDSNLSSDEIARQTQAVRMQASNSGEIHYHLRNVLENPALNAAVRSQYAQPALVPTTTWLDPTPPEKPRLERTENYVGCRIQWGNPGTKPARWWLLQSCTKNIWTTEILPEGETSQIFYISQPDAVSLRAVDRLGNLSEPAVWMLKKFSPADTSKGATKMQK